MSTVHFRNARVFIGGFEVTGDFDQLGVDLMADSLDQTSFGDTVRRKKGGLTTYAVSGSGNWNAALTGIDSVAFGLVGSDNSILTVFANGITEGPSPSAGSGFAMKCMLDKFNISGKVSTLLRFDFNAVSEGTGGD